MEKLTEKLGICEVCGLDDAIYTCPKCEVRTCSLPCVKVHKKELECDGIRDKAKYIPVKKFTNLDLLSDYRLMEEITRSVEVYKKDKNKRCTRINKELPVHLFRLKAAAFRRDTLLKYLPMNFTRHKNNTTYLDWSTQIIYWKITWIFLNANSKSDPFVSCESPLCKESEKIGTLLSEFFNPKEADSVLFEQLQYFHSAGLNNVRIFLKAEECPGEKFYELDLSMTVKDCLKCKVVIESPTIHVVRKEHADAYNIIDTDDEMEENKDETILNGNVILKLKTIKRKASESRKKNLLFVSEYSDEELSISSSDDEDSVKIKIPKRSM